MAHWSRTIQKSGCRYRDSGLRDSQLRVSRGLSQRTRTCRGESRRGVCIRIRLQAAEPVSGAICLWLGALGLGRPTRLPRPGDYPPKCLRSCLDRRLVLRREGNSVHRLQGHLGRHRPGSFVRGPAGRPVRSEADCGRGHGPSRAVRYSVHHPTSNGNRSSSGHPSHYEPRCPSHHEQRTERWPQRPLSGSARDRVADGGVSASEICAICVICG